MKNQLTSRQAPELDSQLRLKYGIELTDISLGIPPTLEDEEIIEVGRRLRIFNNASAWWLADYILFCQKTFLESRKARRDVYDRIAKLWPQYARSTLKDYATVARRVPADLRSPNLSFEHHSHIATLADEPHAGDLQRHYIKVAEEAEATADQLRLMIADTRKGVQLGKPIKRAKAEAIDVKSSDSDANGHSAPSAHGGADGLPIAKEPEPELLAGGHAQLASEAQRACTRLREWYASQARKTKVEVWSDERKRVLVHDLQPLIKEMHHIVEVFGALTNAEQTGDWPGT